MDDRNEQLKAMLRRAQKQVDGKAPPFASSFGAAQRASRTASRRRYIALGTAAAALAIAVGLLNTQPPEMAYVDMDLILSTTSWEAPSDALLPAHPFDIYHEIPRLIESTEPVDGALL